MSRAGVGMVIEKLLTDEKLRIRFALDRMETVAELFLRGFDLSQDEIDLFCRTDAGLWFPGDTGGRDTPAMRPAMQRALAFAASKDSIAIRSSENARTVCQHTASATHEERRCAETPEPLWPIRAGIPRKSACQRARVSSRRAEASALPSAWRKRGDALSSHQLARRRSCHAGLQL
jgi:hypothetical protein